MGKLSSQNFRISAAVAALALLVTSFQNCGMNASLGTKLKANNQTKGNGEGYGGKTTRYAYNSAKCALDPQSAIQDTAVIQQQGLDFYLIRENCANIQPVKLAPGAVDHMVHRDDLALYDDRVFKEVDPRTGEPESPASESGRTIVSRKYCRGSSSTGYPRQVIDVQLDLDTMSKSAAKVTVANYSAANQIAGQDYSRNLNASAAVSSTAETYNGTGLAAGESYNLRIDSTDNGLLTFALAMTNGPSSASTNFALKCYEF
jgi:hypothetical protein